MIFLIIIILLIILIVILLIKNKSNLIDIKKPYLKSKSYDKEFLVIMSDNRELNNSISDANYNSLAALINYEYCLKYILTLVL